MIGPIQSSLHPLYLLDTRVGLNLSVDPYKNNSRNMRIIEQNTRYIHYRLAGVVHLQAFDYKKEVGLLVDEDLHCLVGFDF